LFFGAFDSDRFQPDVFVFWTIFYSLGEDISGRVEFSVVFFDSGGGYPSCNKFLFTLVRF
jgi:hypothetical protein